MIGNFDRFEEIENSTPKEVKEFVDGNLNVLDKLNDLVEQGKISSSILTEVAKKFNSDDEWEDWHGAHFDTEALQELNTYLKAEDKFPLE